VTRALKVFLSSVRHGLEEERDSLPSLLLALGHIPQRFEDFTAQPMPSRDACLRGVESADVYLLLLGNYYGDPLPDTGASPTEEEFIVARRRGIPILAFRKAGSAPFESRQEEFAKRVEDYRTGLFRGRFANTAELQIEVAKAMREIVAKPPRLEWRPLADALDVRWAVANGNRNYYLSGTVLELQAIPIGANPFLATELSNLPRVLARRGRDAGLFSDDQAVHADHDQDQALASVNGAPGIAGIRVERSHATAVWQQLGRDSLGSILDVADLASRLATMISIAAEGVADDAAVAFGVGLAGTSLSVVGNVSDLGHRQVASIGFASVDYVQVEPRDSLPAAAIPAGAQEIGTELATRLIQAYKASRR
jgi:Domain of unknown function (DUF4062)